jgi:hypothetical protein
MSYSPYQKTVHAPIEDLNPYRSRVSQMRDRYEKGEMSREDQEVLICQADSLVQQCDFLGEKFDMKVGICNITHLLSRTCGLIAHTPCGGYWYSKLI